VPRRLTAALRRLPIRVKLTLAFSGVMAVMLAAIGVFVYLHFVAGLDSSIDQALRARASQITSLVQSPHQVPVTDLQLGDTSQNFAQILNAHGRVLNASVGVEQPLLRPGELARAQRAPVLVERHERSRFLAVPITREGLIVVVGESLGEHEHAIETLGGALLIGGPLALILASLAAYGLAAAALRPVELMRRRAATISAGESSATLPLPESVDEIYRLGSTLNEMLARLEQSFEHERAFVADASHELRMPLTVLKAELEVALKQQSPPSVRAALASAVEEADRVIALAEDLLVLAGADRARLSLELQSVAIGPLADAVTDRYSSAAARTRRRLVVDADPESVIWADPARLQQALANLVDNALRYGRGTITVTVRDGGGWVEVHVTDDGPGFPPAFLPVAFERFTRAQRARGRGGTGLGLAIVEAIARAHGGETHAANRPQGGADVWLALPAGSGAAETGRPIARERSAS
jgi:two-component system, OmpR family, sensor kinase